MKNLSKKVFVLENGTYAELSYHEFCHRNKLVKTYHSKYFVFIYEMLMEVREDAYREFYKTKRRQKYLEERSAKNGDLCLRFSVKNSQNGCLRKSMGYRRQQYINARIGF